jgi:hypothetical protein
MMAGASAAMAALKNEIPLTPLPECIKRGFHEANERESIVAYVPNDENVDDGSSKVAAQIFYGARTSTSTLSRRIWGEIGCRLTPAAARAKSRPAPRTAVPFRLGSMIARSVGFKQKLEATWLKATSGADSLYSVRCAYRDALSRELIGPALDCLKRVSLCGARRADRPSPEGM